MRNCTYTDQWKFGISSPEGLVAHGLRAVRNCPAEITSVCRDLRSALFHQETSCLADPASHVQNDLPWGDATEINQTPRGLDTTQVPCHSQLLPDVEDSATSPVRSASLSYGGLFGFL